MILNVNFCETLKSQKSFSNILNQILNLNFLHITDLNYTLEGNLQLPKNS